LVITLWIINQYLYFHLRSTSNSLETDALFTERYLHIRKYKENKSIGDLSDSKSVKRLLYMMPSNTMDQFLYLQKVIDSLRDICNEEYWHVTLHLQVSNGFNHSHYRYNEIFKRCYCINKQSYMPIIISSYDSIGFGLNSKHREYLKQHIDDYDYFAYSEEDMLFTLSHLKVYIHEMNRIKLKFPRTWLRYALGFLR
jgi:hypothetical protein